MHLTRLTFHPERFPDTQRYPFNLSILHRTPEIRFEGPLTMFVGENGSGKSTVLHALARAAGIHLWRLEEGTRIEANPYQHSLANSIRLDWTHGRVPGAFFASDLFHDFSELLEEWARADPRQLEPFGGSSLLTKSHGQALMAYFTHRYAISGLYLLDEPETALSPKRQLELADLLATTAARGDAQFIVATHSPLVMGATGARLLSFDGEKVAPIRYEATEHYRVYSEWFARRTAQ